MPLQPRDDLGPHSQIKRDQIVEAARRLFLERGFERTSMDAIRDLAGVSKATLYNHYANKEALFSDVVRKIVERLAGDWLQTLGDAAPKLEGHEALRQTLTQLAQRSLETLMRPEYLALVRVVIADIHQFPQLGEIYRSVGPGPALHRFAAFLTHARSQGLVVCPDPDAAARLFLGSILSYALLDGLLASGTPQVPSSVQVAAIVDLFLRALAQ